MINSLPLYGVGCFCIFFVEIGASGNFGGVGGALPDRLNLFRAQVLRSVGGNAWRMAHNPPSITRLDYMDALGMVALDENRDYGGHRGQVFMLAQRERKRETERERE